MIIYGKKIANQIKQQVKQELKNFKVNTGVVPHLGVILVGSDPASQIYVRNKRQACQDVGIRSSLIQYDNDVSENEIISVVKILGKDNGVHGILVQLPLPHHIDKLRVFDAINPLKDVDVFHPKNLGLLVQDRPRFLPCTPQAVQEILKYAGISPLGKNVALISRSLIVGQPLASMLLQDHEFANATVTVCHEHTKHLGAITRTADIVISAVGKRPQFVVTADMVQKGSCVIDIGINRIEDKVVGDVDFDSVVQIAGTITKVPGVGSVTVSVLLRNTLKAAQLCHGSNS